MLLRKRRSCRLILRCFLHTTYKSCRQPIQQKSKFISRQGTKQHARMIERMGNEPFTTVTSLMRPMTSTLLTILTRKTSACEPGTMRDTDRTIASPPPRQNVRADSASSCKSHAFLMSFGTRAKYTPPVRRPNSLLSRTASKAAQRVKCKPERYAVHG